MDKFVEVYAASDITFAYLMKANLENAGISVQIANENLQGAYCIDGMVPRVLVPEKYAEQAKEIIKEIQNAPRKDLEDEYEEIDEEEQTDLHDASKENFLMDMKIKEKFITLWKKYFNSAELPIIFYYSNEIKDSELVKPSEAHRCIMLDIAKVRQGNSICFNTDSIGCHGGKRYLGFSKNLMPNFEYFLSCGIPGKLEGERYRKTPELVKELMQKVPSFKAPGKYIVFKRWDKLEESDSPEVVIFFAHGDILSGLFTLANFDADNPNGVFCPFSAGCGSIVEFPYLEQESENPRAVLGMFDVSARPYVAENLLSFSVPLKKFKSMLDNMEESFLITKSWQKVQKRIGN